MRIPLIGAAYQGRSVIASGQRAVNLYAEANSTPIAQYSYSMDLQAPTPVTYYPTPGTVAYLQDINNQKQVRGLYRTSIGTCYAVIGFTLYQVDTTSGALAQIGIVEDLPSQVKMADNGLAVVLVDGENGYAIDMVTNAFGQITDPAFYPADYVTFLDTFFCFNRSGTNQFFISLSEATYAMLTGGTAFDPLDIAAKAGSADPIKAIVTVHKELWLIGELTTEVWIGTGAADFYFQQVQGAYINHGCLAQYSVACQDVLVFWLMQDREGKLLVVRGQGYDVAEITTPRIVEEFQAYDTVSDAIGFCFQISDHAFYCLVFPTANKTWLFDLKTGRWCEWAWLDDNGNLNRHRANCAAFAGNMNLIGDWQNGKILKLDPDTYTDEGSPITRIRTIPHLIKDGERITYQRFIADMQVGTYDDQNDDPPMVSLSWSDDRGVSYGNPIEQSLGSLGDYLAQPSWNRLGMARDRVFKLQWSAPMKTALNGAFIDYKSAKT